MLHRDLPMRHLLAGGLRKHAPPPLAKHSFSSLPSAPRRRRLGWLAFHTSLLGLLLLMGCGAGAQKPAIDTALDNDELRRESFEATLRVLDENPTYVDEFLMAAKKHPATLDRFLRSTARELRSDEFSRFAAERLVSDPEGLRQTLVACLDAASDDPAALRAISEAMAARAQVSAIVVVQSDASIRGNLRALLQEVQKNPEARQSFLVAVSENSNAMARVLAPNGAVLGQLVKAFARVGVDKAEKELSALAAALE